MVKTAGVEFPVSIRNQIENEKGIVVVMGS